MTMGTGVKPAQGPADGREEVQPEAAAVLQMLDQILVSPPFRTSKQCQNLLRYMVQHSLGGDEAGLRERVVGVEVFGRASDYDTSEDPVVRMRAADIRKRLAQFYQAAERDGTGVHIELRPGSYRVTFRSKEQNSRPTAVKAVTPGSSVPLPIAVVAGGADAPRAETMRQSAGVQHSRVWLRLSLGGLMLLLVLVAAFVWLLHSKRLDGAQRRFWAPIAQSGRPVLLYLGSNVAYILQPAMLEKYQRDHGKPYTGPEFFPELPKDGSVRTEDLIPQPNTFVTVGDLAASAQLVSLMSRWSTPFLLRSAEDVSMGELRSSPTVLIGGFNNRWTLETMKDLPFAFRDGRRIQSRSDPSHGWSIPTGKNQGNTEDFALISRVLHADTGGPVLAVGGIGSFGTQAAAEFVSSEEEMTKLLKSAPRGWEGKNMQVVLRIKVVDYTPVAVEVVDTAFW